MAVRNLITHGIAFGKEWLLTHGLGDFGMDAVPGNVAINDKAVVALATHDHAMADVLISDRLVHNLDAGDR